jgi:hypothetical protein
MSERMTKRKENGGVRFSNGEYWNTVYPQNEHCLTDIHRMASKLCDLEDKIEQGKILELPCVVGEKVWFATCVCDEIGKEKYDALEGEVISFSMQKYGLWVYCRYKCGLTYWHTIDGFKAEVFLTPEEANKKLKELENEQR